MSGKSAIGLAVLCLVLPFVSTAFGWPEVRETAEDRVIRFLTRYPDYKPGPNADELATLRIQRFNAANCYVHLMLVNLGEPRILYTDRLCDVVKLMVAAELEMVSKREEKIAIL